MNFIMLPSTHELKCSVVIINTIIIIEFYDIKFKISLISKQKREEN